MSKENHPHLLDAFSHQDNFKIIVETLEKHFSDLFYFDVLEAEIQKKF